MDFFFPHFHDKNIKPFFFIVDHVNLTMCRTAVTTYTTRAADNLIKKTDARKLFNFNTNNMSKLFPLCYRSDAMNGLPTSIIYQYTTIWSLLLDIS